MVSKKFGDLLVSAELVHSEMWRKGTILMRFELGDEYEIYHVSPVDVKKFRASPPPNFIEFMELESWISDVLNEAMINSIDNLVWDLIESEYVYSFWLSDLTRAQMEELAERYGFSTRTLMEWHAVQITDDDGYVIGGCEVEDPFLNPLNKLNPRD